MTTDMSKEIRNVIALNLKEKTKHTKKATKTRGTLWDAPQPRKGQQNRNKNVNDVIDVTDLNQRKMDSGLSKLSSHDIAYNKCTIIYE
jgi:hypothetical protein